VIKKGIEWISDIVGFEVYEELELQDRMSFKVGQVYLAPVKYPMTPPKVLRLESYNPEREEDTQFTMTNYDPASADQEIPLKFLNLKSDNRLFILQGKRRPVIVLGCCESDWPYNHRLGFGHTDKLVLCLPVFRFKDRHTQDYIIKIQAFLISNLFYISPSPKGIPEEGAAQFELIQTIHKADMQPLKNVNNKPFKLSNYTLQLLWNQLALFISMTPLDESLQRDLKAYQDLALEKLKEIN
jgi:hypothetical protein